MKLKWIIIGAVLVLLLYRSVFELNSYAIQWREELGRLHIDIEGFVTKIFKTGQHDFAVINLNLTKKNTDQILDNGVAKHYYCLIKDNQAVIINQLSNIKLGDSLKLNTDSATIEVYRSRIFIEKLHIVYEIEDSFYEQFKPYIMLQ